MVCTSWATFPPVFSGRSYRRHFVPRSFVPFMKCTIQGSKRPHAWCPPPFAGPTWGGTLPQPPAAAWAAKEEKFTNTFICNLSRFKFHSGGLRTFTLILLVHCLGHQVFLTFLRSWTGLQGGQRQFRCPPPPPPTVQRRCYTVGSRDSASLPQLPVTGGRNLQPRSGPLHAASSPSPTYQQLPTILRQMDWWKGSIGG